MLIAPDYTNECEGFGYESPLNESRNKKDQL